MKKLLLTLALVMFAGSVQAAEPAKGDVIWAQWKPNAWFHGKVADKCDYGYIVNFDDGDVGCVPKSLMAKDKPMAAASIVPGTRVLAKWSNGNLYPATVSGKPDGGKVKVFFDDRTVFVSTVASLRAIGY